MLTWLSVQEHGAAQPFRPKDVAALLVAEGVYLFARIAEQPEILPVEPRGRGRIGRRLTRSMRSGEAERSSVFLAHALLVLAEGNFRETANTALRRVALQGREFLSYHYPLATTEGEWLESARVAFRNDAAVAREPSSGVRIPTYAAEATAMALEIALGKNGFSVGRERRASPEQMLLLTHTWFEFADHQVSMLREWLAQPEATAR